MAVAFYSSLTMSSIPSNSMLKRIGVIFKREDDDASPKSQCYGLKLLLAAAVALSPFSTTPACAATPEQIRIDGGAHLFRRACIGCHDAGGNIIQPGATLFFKDLQRNGVDTEEEIYRVTYFGKGRMPGFGEKCGPRGQCTFGPRLKDDEIKLLAEFVRSQADRDWPPIAVDAD